MIPKVLAEKPIIKGTRIAVEFILELLANGWTVKDICSRGNMSKAIEILQLFKNRAIDVEVDLSSEEI